MVHTMLIGLHAASAVVAFLAGIAAVRWRSATPAYLIALVLMSVGLAGAVVEEWARIDLGTRVVFVGLCGLAAVVVALGVLVLRLSDSVDPAAVGRRWSALGFTLVSLFAAYVVIQVKGLGAPLPLILLAVAAASIGGHVVLRLATPAALRARSGSVL